MSYLWAHRYTWKFPETKCADWCKRLSTSVIPCFLQRKRLSLALRLPEAEYKLLCAQILRRDGFKCRSCQLRQNLHVHHIVFRSQLGPDESWNLLTVCSSCHDGIHTAIKDGEPGLRIKFPVNADKEVEFTRASWWHPC